MAFDPLTLRQQIEATLLKVNMQIDVVENYAARHQEQANEMTYRDGKYVMIPLLVAKADLLNALLTLEVLERTKRAGN